jgi:hypothetical protein
MLLLVVMLMVVFTKLGAANSNGKLVYGIFIIL